MRGSAAWIVLVLALSLWAVGPAEAKNMHGKFGGGFQSTLLSARGLSFSYWTSPRLAISMLVGVGFVLGDTDTTTILGSGGLRYVVHDTRFANLSVGARVDFGWANKIPYSGPDGKHAFTTTSATQWGIELPVEVEYFLSDAFSVNLGTGVTFTMVPDLAEEDVNAALLRQEGLGAATKNNETGIAIGAGALFGDAGFTFYF